MERNIGSGQKFSLLSLLSRSREQIKGIHALWWCWNTRKRISEAWKSRTLDGINSHLMLQCNGRLNVTSPNVQMMRQMHQEHQSHIIHLVHPHLAGIMPRRKWYIRPQSNVDPQEISHLHLPNTQKNNIKRGQNWQPQPSWGLTQLKNGKWWPWFFGFFRDNLSHLAR